LEPGELGVRFKLLHRGNTILLGVGTTVIGRSAGCKIVLDDNGVSRRHARLEVSEQRVLLEDLDSANGVLVNGERIEGSRTLAHGDHVLIGAHDLEVVADAAALPSGSDAVSSAAPAKKRARRAVSDSLWSDEEPVGAGYGPVTARWDETDLLGEAVGKLLGGGDVGRAEALVRPNLEQRLERAKRGESLEEGSALWAVGCAVKLCLAGRTGRWLGFPLELYAALDRPLPAEIITQIESLVEQLGVPEPGPIEQYVGARRAAKPAPDATERDALERLERLAKRAK
jgi:hypothetical protein